MLNEFRQDPVSGEWVLISTERAKKPDKSNKTGETFFQDKDHCPFEEPQKSDNKEPILVYNCGKKVEWTGKFEGEWTTQVIENKFPAIRYGLCKSPFDLGPFRVVDGFGFHELVITRDHDKSFAQFSNKETAEVLMVYKERYNAIIRDKCGEYVLIFHNHGRLSGASIYHNHSQILSMPVIPEGIAQKVTGAKNFYVQNNRRIHELLLAWEIEQKKRIVYENEKFIALCPFASRAPYEVRIFPKTPQSDFSQANDADIPLLADALNVILRKMYYGLNDIDYSFFIHTAPHNNKGEFESYYWHLEIMPRMSIAAGFELGTNIFINVVDPDDAAKLLRDTNV